MSITSRLRRRTVLIASGTAVLIAVSGGTTAAFAAGAPTPSASPSAAASCTPHLRAVVAAAPAKLKDDLAALRKAPKDERAKDRAAIRAKALAGAYGGRAERLSRIVAGGRGGAAKALPAALRTDLQHLRTTTKPRTDERKAAAAAIVTKAEHGTYGTAVQQRVQQRQQRCEAKQAE